MAEGMLPKKSAVSHAADCWTMLFFCTGNIADQQANINREAMKAAERPYKYQNIKIELMKGYVDDQGCMRPFQSLQDAHNRGLTIFASYKINGVLLKRSLCCGSNCVERFPNCKGYP
jgi:hypothetical protein